MNFAPLDQSGIFGNAMAGQGDYRAEQQRAQLLSLQQEQVRAQQAAAQAEQQRQALYQQAVGEFIKNPTPQGAAELQMRFPEQREAIKGGWEAKEKAAQDADLREMSKIFGYLNSGVPEKARAALDARISADREAGQDTSDDEAILDLINTDPEKAKGVTAYMLSSIAGADHMSALLEQTRLSGKGQDGFTLGQGQKRFDANGNIIAEVAPETEYLVIPEGGKAVPKGSLAGGGGQASGGAGSGLSPAVPASGSAIETAALSAVPGAVVTSRQRSPGKNASVGGVPNSYHLTDQARDFVPPSGMGMGELTARLRRALPGYDVIRESDHVHVEPASRTAAVATGGRGDPAGTLYGDPKAKTRVLSREEIAQIPGLDPNTAYQQSPEGTITAIGGQNKSQLKAWPQNALGARASNDAALTNIGGAIALLNPANNSKEAQTARNAIGFGTGFFGDRVTQWNDPDGTDARARIGQIGGLIIKDTSGAAVSLAEDARLAKWVPLVTDSPKVALAKLKNLQRELRQRNAAMDESYSEDQGYRPFKNNSGGPPQGAIDLLRSNPRLAPQFDAKYGPGMARKVLGK